MGRDPNPHRQLPGWPRSGTQPGAPRGSRGGLVPAATCSRCASGDRGSAREPPQAQGNRHPLHLPTSAPGRPGATGRGHRTVQIQTQHKHHLFPVADPPLRQNELSRDYVPEHSGTFQAVSSAACVLLGGIKLLIPRPSVASGTWRVRINVCQVELNSNEGTRWSPPPRHLRITQGPGEVKGALRPQNVFLSPVPKHCLSPAELDQVRLVSAPHRRAPRGAPLCPSPSQGPVTNRSHLLWVPAISLFRQ